MITAGEAREIAKNNNFRKIEEQIRSEAMCGSNYAIFGYLTPDEREWLESFGYSVTERTAFTGTKLVWQVSW